MLGTVAQWQPGDWTLSLAARRDGQVVGRQDLMARRFAVTREARTGSWLGLPFQRMGIGTEMRAAVLHLAFALLGTETVTSSARTDSTGSLGVSRKLGYHDDGFDVMPLAGSRQLFQRLRLDRSGWASHRTVPVEVTGFDPCRELFGVAEA